MANVQDDIQNWLYAIHKHLHSPTFCYPSLVAPIQVMVGNGAWTLGELTEIIPAGIITKPFELTALNIGDVSGKDTYELWVYAGTTEVIGKLRFLKDSMTSGSFSLYLEHRTLEAGTQINVRLACAEDGSKNIKMSVQYHLYERCECNI